MKELEYVYINDLKQKGYINFESLSNLYQDIEELKQQISLVIEPLIKNSVIKNKSILIKPNWVRHSLNPLDKFCLYTNENFILAFIELLLELKPKSITIGDAPIQGCNWDKLINSDFLGKIENLSFKYQTQINVKDFRRIIFDTKLNNKIIEKNPIENYLIFDVGKKSYLEEITDIKNKFRVTVYNPDKFIESHALGMHKYCISKDLFEADIIISLPKLKTHQKTGLTGALKNIVGFNGDKDYLPHHRIGGTGLGGDCYPGDNKLRYLSELALDNANRNKGNRKYLFWSKLASVLWKLSFPKKIHSLEAGWYGNDTTWRMVMDLNQIIYFGNKDGELSETPVREFYSLNDGIIGGEGDGPLNPSPLNLGIISFTNSSTLSDLSTGILMGMNVEKIKLLKASKKMIKSKNNFQIKLNGTLISLKELEKHKIYAKMPSGWLDYNKTK